MSLPAGRHVATAVSFDATLLEQVRALAADSVTNEKLRTILRLPNSANVDAEGLRPQDYDEVTRLLGLKSDHVTSATLKQYIDDGVRFNTFRAKQAIKYLNKARRDNARLSGRRVNFSQIVTTLIALGMEHIEQELGSGASDDQVGRSTQSGSGAQGHAGKAARKPADHKARKADAAGTGNRRRRRAA